MQFLTLIRGNGNHVQQVEKSIRALPKAALSGVKVIGTFTSLGQYDGVVLFDADSEKLAVNFVSENVRSIDGVLSTETLPLIPLVPIAAR